MALLEALCRRCNHRFNPHSESPEDLEHGGFETDDGEWVECGGQGEVMGAYYFNGELG